MDVLAVVNTTAPMRGAVMKDLSHSLSLSLPPLLLTVKENRSIDGDPSALVSALKTYIYSIRIHRLPHCLTMDHSFWSETSHPGDGLQ